MARRGTATAADFTALGLCALGLWTEASMVVGMRMMGMAGLWPVHPDETLRMMVEKPPAFSDAALAGASAAWNGKRPDQIAAAVMAPLTRKARSNRRRLVKGPPRRGS